MKSVPIDEVAKWFVVGFKRCWTLREVVEASGLGLFGDGAPKIDFQALNAAYPFWPKFWFFSTQVRAVVAAEYPKLFKYLEANANNPEKLAKAIPQVARLVSKNEARYVVNSDERRELVKTRKELAASTYSYRKSRGEHKSHQRSAWNVCKG